MRHYTVVFAPEAEADLLDIYDWIAEAASMAVAIRYIDRIEAFCAGFDHFPERGTLRADIRPGLRTIGFERRKTNQIISVEQPCLCY